MEYEFNCHGCGACCNGYVSFTIRESLDFCEDFIIGTRIGLQPRRISGQTVEDKSNLEDTYTYREKAYPTVNIHGKPHIFFVSMFQYGYARSLGRCEKLLPNGLCGIYDRRPLMCRSVPFQPTIPEHKQGEILEEYREGGTFHKQGCLVSGKSDTHPLVFSSGKIVSKPLGDAREAMWEQIVSEAGAHYIFARVMVEDVGLPPSVLESCEDGKGWISVHPLTLLSAAASLELFSREEMDRFIVSQARLIDTEISKALNRKEKSERKITNELRKWRSLYEEWLSNRPQSTDLL